jgi:hypothetical protein
LLLLVCTVVWQKPQHYVNWESEEEVEEEEEEEEEDVA